jgi:hypothetical protein
VFVRRRDGTLANYPGSSPEFVAHPWLRGKVETTLAGELSELPSAIVVPVGRANRAIAHLQMLGAVDPARCLIGLPHPSPASPGRERYFQNAKAQLVSQVRRLAPGAAPRASRRALPQHSQARTASAPWADPARKGRTDRIVIPLTQGNLNNNHVYLRGHLDFFPSDTIGAANARDGQGALLTVHFAGLPEVVETDIAAGKDLFRRRGPWRKFFAHHCLQPGDSVAIERLSPYEYRVVPVR